MNEDAIALLNALISTNASRRISDANDDLIRDRIRHTQYLGDRTVQQLGQEPIENAVVLNNAANAIGDALMPLAKGSPLGRYDSVNQDDNVGTAKRALLDLQANRDGNDNTKDRTGQQKPANNPLKGTPRGKDPLPKTYPPPYGCVPVGGQNLNCIWTASATPPSNYESHGSAVINQDGLELFLHCKLGIVPPQSLGCDFLSKWKCFNGVCSQDANGIYSTQVECESALIPPPFFGGQCIGILYTVTYKQTFTNGSYQIASQEGNGAFTGVIQKINPSSGTLTYYLRFSDGDRQLEAVSSLSFAPQILSIIRADGLPDNCGNLPYTCP